jgi:hypothetical protein
MEDSPRLMLAGSLQRSHGAQMQGLLTHGLMHHGLMQDLSINVYPQDRCLYPSSGLPGGCGLSDLPSVKGGMLCCPPTSLVWSYNRTGAL